MTKEQIGKEIKDLIRSIKTHYTFVEEEDRIPMIELELITSKIRKLYEKSILSNYLHSTDEMYMSQERSRRMGNRPNFEKNTRETFVKQTEPEVVAAVEPIIVAASVETPVVEQRIVAAIVEPAKVQVSGEIGKTASGKPLKDLKLLIGINDKFLLINNLFSRNDADYKVTMEYLSSLQTYSDAYNHLLTLARQNAWNLESYAFVRFQQIVEKRYK